MNVVVFDMRNKNTRVVEGDIIKLDSNTSNLFLYLDTGYYISIDKNRLLNFIIAEKLLGERT